MVRLDSLLEMEQILSTLDFETKGEGFTDITKDIDHWIKYKRLKKGILLIFLNLSVISCDSKSAFSFKF